MMKSFRILGWLEALSLLALMFVAMPLKYYFGHPEYVRVVGSAHGLLFVLYCMAAIFIGSETNWKIAKTLFCLVLACLPFGTIYFDRKYLS